jgi:signal transduction histidine kinase
VATQRFLQVDGGIRVEQRNVIASDGSRGRLEARSVSHSAHLRQNDASTLSIALYLSHDIRHHLAVIWCNTESLAHPATLETERASLTSDIQESIHDITDILDFVLAHTRTHTVLKEEPASLRNLIEQRAQSVRMHPCAQGVRVEVRAHATALKGRFNRTVVGTAVYNLLLNACSAAKRGDNMGAVEVSLREDREFIYIDVTDDGPGVDPEIVSCLFAPVVTSDKSGHQGLGTTLIHYAARAYGGCLGLERTGPGCTTFVLSFAKARLGLQQINNG